jgi:tRNA pseudouridine38-40 synthase
MRFALNIEYVGSNYFGFQNQIHDKLPTIQQKLEEAISEVANHPVSITAAGRTDAGVHATGQIIHFDTNSIRSERGWLLGINSNLPHDICVNKIKKVPEDFHARFSATARRYQYLIFNSPMRSAILYHRATLYYRLLDENKMNKAAQYLSGEHDFSSFRAAQCQSKSPIRKINDIKVERQGSFIVFEIEANAFLYHMVRNIMGVLLEVGCGEKSPEYVLEVLKHKDREKGGITAPAEGLYLVKVIYPDHINL